MPTRFDVESALKLMENAFMKLSQIGYFDIIELGGTNK
jgi:hypothetical protein